MRVFFDTSVLVAALFEGHAFHRQAFPWLKRAREREFSFLVATHTLAELYWHRRVCRSSRRSLLVRLKS